MNDPGGGRRYRSDGVGAEVKILGLDAAAQASLSSRTKPSDSGREQKNNCRNYSVCMYVQEMMVNEDCDHRVGGCRWRACERKEGEITDRVGGGGGGGGARQNATVPGGAG